MTYSRASASNGWFIETNVLECPNQPPGVPHKQATQYVSLHSTTGALRRCRCKCREKTCNTWKGKKVLKAAMPDGFHALMWPAVVTLDARVERAGRTGEGLGDVTALVVQGVLADDVDEDML